MIRPLVFSALLLLVSGCGASGPVPEGVPIAADEATGEDLGSSNESETSTATDTSATRSASAAVGDETDTSTALDDPAVVFLALVDEALVDTDWEGAAFDAPEVFVANGQLMCERLGDTASIDDVLTEFARTLTNLPIEEIDNDTATLAGALLGTAVATLCPEYQDVLEESR